MSCDCKQDLDKLKSLGTYARVEGKMHRSKRLLIGVVSAATATAAVVPATYAQTSCYSSGNSIYCSDGYSAYRSGNSLYGNDGYSSYSSGNSIYGNDGYSAYSSGNSIYGNDGYSAYRSGNSIYGNH